MPPPLPSCITEALVQQWSFEHTFLVHLFSYFSYFFLNVTILHIEATSWRKKLFRLMDSAPMMQLSI